MNDITTSADTLPKPSIELTFDTLPVDRLILPKELFDDRVPIDRERQSLFLPIIVSMLGDLYLIVDGGKSYRTLIENGHARCACGIITPGLDSTQAGLLRVRLNGGRELHAREKLLFIRWLRTNLDQDGYQRFVGEIRTTQAERHDFEKLSTCSDLLCEPVMQGVLDPAVAPELTHLSEPDTTALVTLFSKLSFSRQMQRELAEWLHEISVFGKTSISESLALKEVEDILTSTTLNAPQKISRFHEFVYAKRFPLYSKAKKAWTRQVHLTNPDPGRITFQASPFFEKNDLEVRIKVKSADAAKETLEKLSRIPADIWKGLIDPTTLI
jgi:hypothetical protein